MLMRQMRLSLTYLRLHRKLRVDFAWIMDFVWIMCILLMTPITNIAGFLSNMVLYATKTIVLK